jgi:hypothetical protein
VKSCFLSTKGQSFADVAGRAAPGFSGLLPESAAAHKWIGAARTIFYHIPSDFFLTRKKSVISIPTQ